MVEKNGLSEFEEKVVIVTGAARGVGKATALKFSKHGANLVIVDVLEKELNEVGQIIREKGKKVLPMKADVSDNRQVQYVVKKTLDDFRKIDVLVNNAAIAGPSGPVINLAEKDWDDIFRINLKSMFLFCKNVVPVMINNKKGNIVNLASIAGKEGNENLGAYSASKAGVMCLSRVLAKEVAMYGIRVNSIAPALINTAMPASVPKEIIDKLLTKIPLGRMGEPEEVANLILFLSSEKSSFITGQCFNITGGRGDY
jgi:3-oxoacyl-[acyl-carrier protein] reductase